MIEQEIIEMLSSIVEEKDAYTSGHSKRVAMYSVKIAHALGLSQEEQNTIYQAGLLHDIGKILTSEAVLLKPRKFNRNEYTIIKNHSCDGARMVSFISSFRDYADTIEHHHEHFDGKGYPHGLKGESIPLFSRIMCIADAFDAMTTNRIYKVRKDTIQAIEELKKCSGKQFDPNIIPFALDVFSSFREIIDTSQSPQDATQEARFSYFFKDSLTSAYSGEYLNYFLQRNNDNHGFRCCYFIQVHHMQKYNEQMGWKSGDAVLIEVALRLKVLLHTAFVFRIFGDDFVALSPLHVEVDLSELQHKLTCGFNGLAISCSHFDLKDSLICKWEQLEKYLLHSDYTEAVVSNA